MMTDPTFMSVIFLVLIGTIIVSRKSKAMPLSLDEMYKVYGLRYDITWQMIKAISIIESNQGEDASVAWGIAHPNDVEKSASSDGKSWGIMQLTLNTAKDYDQNVTPEKLNNPEYSIKIAAQHLNRLTKIFKEEEFVVKAYNQGEGNTARELSHEITGYASTYFQRYLQAKSKINQGTI